MDSSIDILVSNNVNIIDIIAVTISILALVFSFVSFIILRNVKNKNKIVDLIASWNEKSYQYSSARLFTECQSEDVQKKIAQRSSFTIPADDYSRNLLKKITEDKTFGDNASNMILVSDAYSAEIRQQVIAYLNALETIAIAINNKIADKKIMLKEFQYLFSNNKLTLQYFRSVIQAGSYPEIEALEAELTASIQSSKISIGKRIKNIFSTQKRK
jgi:hypothetical protein